MLDTILNASVNLGVSYVDRAVFPTGTMWIGDEQVPKTFSSEVTVLQVDLRFNPQNSEATAWVEKHGLFLPRGDQSGDAFGAIAIVDHAPNLGAYREAILSVFCSQHEGVLIAERADHLGVMAQLALGLFPSYFFRLDLGGDDPKVVDRAIKAGRKGLALPKVEEPASMIDLQIDAKSIVAHLVANNPAELIFNASLEEGMEVGNQKALVEGLFKALGLRGLSILARSAAGQLLNGGFTAACGVTSEINRGGSDEVMTAGVSLSKMKGIRVGVLEPDSSAIGASGRAIEAAFGDVRQQSFLGFLTGQAEMVLPLDQTPGARLPGWAG